MFKVLLFFDDDDVCGDGNQDATTLMEIEACDSRAHNGDEQSSRTCGNYAHQNHLTPQDPLPNTSEREVHTSLEPNADSNDYTEDGEQWMAWVQEFTCF